MPTDRLPACSSSSRSILFLRLRAYRFPISPALIGSIARLRLTSTPPHPPPTYGFTFDRTGAVVNRDRKSPSLAATIVLRVHRSSIRVPEIRVIPSIFPLIEPADWPVAEPNELKFRLIIFALACRGRGPPTRDEIRTRRGVAREKFRLRSLLDPTMKFLGETGGFVDGWMERGGGYIYIYIYWSHGVKKKKSCKWNIGKGPTPRRTRHCHLAECPRTHGKLQSA